MSVRPANRCLNSCSLIPFTCHQRRTEQIQYDCDVKNQDGTGGCRRSRFPRHPDTGRECRLSAGRRLSKLSDANSLEETLLSLLFTIVLVIFVTYLFLGSVRATLVPTIAVPVSIIGTLAALHLLGLTINTVTLFALILAIGLVVDDAIIVVENVERLMHDKGMEARPATQQAMKEVAAPIFATSTVLVPTSFIPEEDNGYFMVEVQLPPAASLNRTAEYIDQLNGELEGDPAIETVLAVNGYSILNSALQPNAGMIIIKLTPWEERKDPPQQQFAMQQKYKTIFSKIPGGSVTVFGAPALPGMGAVAGFSYILQDTQSQGEQAMASTLTELIGNINGLPEVSGAFSTFRADYPQIELLIDRVEAKTLGVAISDIFLTLQTQLGGYYVNDFNLYGKTYRVMVQADSQFRQTEEDLATLYVANKKGEMVSMGTLVKTTPIQGADILYRYNTYDSTTVNGRPNEAEGYSSGGAMTAIDQLSLDTLPEGFKFNWTGSSYEERKSGNMAPIALGLSLLFTYLFLAALYEPMTIPITIILSVPIAMIGSLIGLLITSEPLSLYGQIGLVLLIGMSAKTAILIVEFAKSQREVDGKSLQDATVEAARLRFRPVCMTALSFLVGVFPLVIASGAGSAARISLGLSIFGGTIAGVIGGTLLVPIFFKLVQTLREKVHGGKTDAPE